MRLDEINLEDPGAAGQIVKVLFSHYFETAGNATPALTLPLIHYLGRLTKEVGDKIAESPGAFIQYAQLRGDLRKWRERLATYREIVERLAKAAPNSPSPELAERVLMPLVSGHYPNEEGRRAPDVSTPIGLLSAAGVTTTNYKHAVVRLADDLEKNAKDLLDAAAALPGKVVDLSAWLKGAIVAAVAIGGLVVYSDFRNT